MHTGIRTLDLATKSPKLIEQLIHLIHNFTMDDQFSSYDSISNRALKFTKIELHSACHFIGDEGSDTIITVL